jgi:hypothetical protein
MGGFSKHLREPPKLVNAHLQADAHQWLANIELTEKRVWLRRNTSTQTIICPIETAGETRCLFARIEGRGKTGIKVVMGISDMKGVKLEKCPLAWPWQVEIAEAVVGEFVAEFLNDAPGK